MNTPIQANAVADGEETAELPELPVRVAATPPSTSLDMDTYADLRRAQEQDPDYQAYLAVEEAIRNPTRLGDNSATQSIY